MSYSDQFFASGVGVYTRSICSEVWPVWVLHIYQDYALDELNLSLPESGLGGTVYGAAAVTAATFIAITHALKLNYNKLLSLIISAFLNRAALILVSIAKDKVPTTLCISHLKSN